MVTDCDNCKAFAILSWLMLLAYIVTHTSSYITASTGFLIFVRPIAFPFPSFFAIIIEPLICSLLLC
jgi:hypothetical protein